MLFESVATKTSVSSSYRCPMAEALSPLSNIEWMPDRRRRRRYRCRRCHRRRDALLIQKRAKEKKRGRLAKKAKKGPGESRFRRNNIIIATRHVTTGLKPPAYLVIIHYNKESRIESPEVTLARMTLCARRRLRPTQLDRIHRTRHARN